MKKVLIGTVLLMLYTNCTFFAARSTSPENYCTTVATIVERDFSTTGQAYIKYEYYAGTENYQGLCVEYLSWVPNGEKYLLAYDSLYPEIPKYVGGLSADHPVFLPGEVTKYTVGKIRLPRKNDILIEFEYTISGVYYKRIQFLEGRHSSRNQPQLVNGATFLVEYWVQNPKRAIIYIDKPERYIHHSESDSMSFPVSPNIHVLRPVWDTIPVLLPDSVITKSRPGW
jgi:hypothetical protein